MCVYSIYVYIVYVYSMYVHIVCFYSVYMHYMCIYISTIYGIYMYICVYTIYDYNVNLEITGEQEFKSGSVSSILLQLHII